MKIFWCKECKIPIIKNSNDSYTINIKENELNSRLMNVLNIPDYNKNIESVHCPLCNQPVEYITTDLRPVFMPERILLSEITGVDYTGESIWNAVGTRYYVDGKKIDISFEELNSKLNSIDINSILKKIEMNDEEVDLSLFVRANLTHYKFIEAAAFNFIWDITRLNANRLPVVSFSGGKDSTAVSDLVIRALNNLNVLHVFGDTTLEFPSTYDYVERMKNLPKHPPFLPVDEAETDFKDLVRQFGPPSRVIRWCCTIYKTGPIGKLFQQLGEFERILTFYGIRRSESNSRSDYKPITHSPKISQQLVVSPIIGWHDIDVWLYILSRGIDFNDAYRLGFTRVGCWCCPNNSDWSEFLCKIFLKENADEWRRILVEFAKKIGKPDPEVYVDEGGWKARQGGQGLNTSNVELESKPCALEDTAKNYSLKRPVDDSLYELFKPFGIVDKNKGRDFLGEVFILDYKTGEPWFLLQGNKGSKELKVRLIDTKNLLLTFQRIECQLRKFQSCIICSACTNVCPFGAITIVDSYKIDDEKCSHCMKCIAHFHKGCLVTKMMVDY